MKHQEDRRKLIEEGLLLYDHYNQEYKKISPANYQRRLEKKRRLGVRPLYTLKKIDLDDFIKSPLLEAKNKVEAEILLKKMDFSEISNAVKEVKKLVNSSAWTNLRNWACDYKAQMKQFKEGKKSNYSMSAESRRSQSRKTHQHHIVPIKNSVI